MATQAPPAPSPYPNQWYLACFSRDLSRGDVRPVKMFGHDLVVFRTQDGEAHVVDPHCPHFGAHLGHGGRVVDNCIRCPFHGWQYDGASGQCTHIPNGDAIPKAAKLNRWHVEEHSGMVLVWRSEDGSAPSWRVRPLPDFAGPQWSSWIEDDWTLSATIQDISENDADWSHSPIMHGFLEGRPVGEAEIDGALFTWNLKVRAKLTAFGIPLALTLPESMHSRVTSRRWGLAIGWITQHMPLVGGLEFRTQTLATTTPLDDKTVRLRMLHRVRKLPVPGINGMLRDTYARTFRQTVDEDVAIWRHKIYLTRPLATKSDAGVLKFRKWAKQFYSAPTAPPRKLVRPPLAVT